MNAKKLLFAGVCLLAACFTQAQESQMPKAFSYQAVVRDNAGKVVADKEVGVKIEILKGSAESGTVVYEETLRPKSTLTGTVNMMIGNGNAAQFAAIDWGGNAHFLRISLSLDGGEYKVVSTTQMLPVPYALYAEKAGSVVNGGTGGTTSHSDYILTSDTEDSVSGILSGEYTEQARDGVGILGLNWNLAYLTGTNLNLDLKFEGWPEGKGITDDSTIYPSTAMSRVGVTRFNNIPIGTYSLKMLIVDAEGKTLREFPFTFTVKE